MLVLVSLSWPSIVEPTPKDRRPYIGESKNNSALDLAVGYNGLGRVFGGSGNFGPRGGGPPPDDPSLDDEHSSVQRGADGSHSPTTGKAADHPGGAGTEGAPGSRKPEGDGPPPGQPQGLPPGRPGFGFPPPGGPGGAGRLGPPGGFGGAPRAWRFASPLLAGQITWLIPLGLVGCVAAVAHARWRRPSGPVLIALLLWSGWLLTHWAVFSWAQGIFHEYYTTVMGPAVAALAGIGAAALWKEWFYEGRWRGVFPPVALLLTAAWQGFVIHRNPDVPSWLLPTLLATIGLGTASTALAQILAGRWGSSRCAKPAAMLGLTAQLVALGYWSLSTVFRPGNPVMPAANPSAFSDRRPGGPPGRPNGPPPFAEGAGHNARLVGFLRTNRHGERILVAAAESRAVSSIIIATGEPAVALGGFMGADRVVTPDEFARMVTEGQVRFVFDAGPGGPPPGGPPPGGWTAPKGMPFAPGDLATRRPAWDRPREDHPVQGPGTPNSWLGFGNTVRRSIPDSGSRTRLPRPTPVRAADPDTGKLSTPAREDEIVCVSHW